MPVLVSYATKHGSTQDVAEAIAETLDAHGLDVDVLPARQVTDIGRYDAVVVGGALYMGHWHRDALRLLRRHADTLKHRPLALFAMGPMSLEPRVLASARRQLEHALHSVPHLSPVSTAVFGGVVDPSELHFPFNHMPPADARDWDAIRAWAEELATRFAAHAPPHA
jgi:menaquinone-dependent protoporphyrinogen oxidase